MPYQAFSETGDTVINMEDEEGVNENSPLYPFGVPVILLNVKSQMAFVRKVWIVFALQFIFMTASTAFLLSPSQYHWRIIVQGYLWSLPLCLVLSIILLIGLTWKSNDSFQPPWYLVVLYTLVNAYLISVTASLIKLYCVLDTLIILLVVTLSIIGYTYQYTYRFKSKEVIILVLTVIAITALILHPWLFSFWDALPAVIFSTLLSLFFILDNWYMLKTMSKNDYLAVSMQTYLDLMVPFRSIHHICELTAELDDDTDDESEYVNNTVNINTGVNRNRTN